MPSERVGSLYVAVGVDGDQAVLEAKQLNRELYKVAKQIQLLNNGANFNKVTRSLQQVQQQAKQTQQALGAATTSTRQPSTQTMAQMQAEALQMNRAFDQTRAAQQASAQAMSRIHEQALRENARITQARQKSARDAMAAVQAEAIAANREYDKKARAAERAAERAKAAQERASRAAISAMLREAYQANRLYDQRARAAERAAAKEARAAALASQSRVGAIKRAGADVASAGAAFASGNPAYALANLAQAGVKVTGVFSGVTASTVAMTAAIAAVPVAAVAAVGGITALGTKIAWLGLQNASSQQLLEIQFEGLLGSAQKAQSEVDYLLQMSTESLVPTEQLMEADRMLLAFGARHQGLRRDMLEFISAFASVTGASQMQVQNLGYALGQIVSIGKVSMQDMRQLGNAGIEANMVYREVAKQQGISVAEARKWVTEGKMTAGVILPAILAQTQKLEGAQKKARESAAGILANIRDIAKVNMGRAFGGLLNMLTPILKWAEDFVRAFDFRYIAESFQQVVGYFQQAFAGMGADAASTSRGISETIGKTINLVGYAAVRIAQAIVAVFDTVMIAVNVVWATVQGVFAAMMKSVSIITGIAGEVPGPWQDAMKSVSTSSDNAFQGAAEGAGIAAQGIIASAGAAGQAWWNMFNQIATFQLPARAPGPFSDSGRSARAEDYYTPAPQKPWVPPALPPTPTPTGSSSSSSGESKALKAAKALIEAWKELTDQAIAGRDALREAFTVPFAAKQPGAVSKAFEAFSSGDVDTIVGQYKEIKQALVDYYSLLEAKGGKAGKKATAQRRADIAFLKEQTGELVRLAAERKALDEQLTDLEEKYNKTTDALSKQRAAQQRQYAAQQKAIAKQYDSYYEATSKTEGRFVKGAIAIAEEALAAATTAYDKANEKLNELKAAREEFMSSLMNMARSFVNDLSKVNREVTTFTRLDNVGSFSEVTQNIADTKSFTDGLKERLQALKDFAANVKTLIAAGLDTALLQQITQAGPEQAGALASALAGASSAEISEINAVQAELAATVTGMQQETSAAWFDAGIAAQEAFTSPLRTAMEEAQKNVDELNRQKELALGILEAWNADQTAYYDEQELQALERYEKDKENLQAALDANQKAAEDVSAIIDARLKGLPSTAYAEGLNTIQGLINGLGDNAKLKELKRAARAMAEVIRDTVNSVLQINSPSRVMMESGYNVGAGLAQGMGMSEPLVTNASGNLANAAMVNLSSDLGSSSGGTTVVKVFIGERELTDIVDTQILSADERSLDYVLAGRRY